MSAIPPRRDYSLVGPEAKSAEKAGLASAQWYACPVPRKQLRELMRRKDGPALRDTAIWLLGLAVSGALAFRFWGSWASLPFFALYGVLYGSASDSRWHECGHGTAFKTRWMNDAVYNLACFMVMREPTVWRWSHTRHHTDTIIVGRDPEIIAPRPPDIASLALNLFNLKNAYAFFGKLFLHATGCLDAEEATFIPQMERAKVFRVARLYLAIFALVIVVCIATRSILPAMFVGLPTLYGGWLAVYFGMTQHLGLAEDVLDHRLNSRTVYMNPFFRFIYWNMNYHVEHHMFPMIPYHALPALHEAIKADCPAPYASTLAAFAEILPTMARQLRDPHYFVRRERPRARAPFPLAPQPPSEEDMMTDNWIDAGDAGEIDAEDVKRFDHAGRTYALYRTEDDRYFATDGLCTHEKIHLADGLVMGTIIECPKHNGRFDFTTGVAKGAPACVNLATYPLKVEGGRLKLRIA